MSASPSPADLLAGLRSPLARELRADPSLRTFAPAPLPAGIARTPLGSCIATARDLHERFGWAIGEGFAVLVDGWTVGHRWALDASGTVVDPSTDGRIEVRCYVGRVMQEARS